MNSNLTAQTRYPYELVKGKDTTVTMLKSQAVYLNQTIAKQREKLNESKLITDSLYKSNKDLDSSFFEAGKLAIYYRAENERLKVENAKLAKRAGGSIKTDIYMSTVWTIMASWGIYIMLR